MEIQKSSSNLFSEQTFQRSKKSLIFSVIGLDAMAVNKKKSTIFNVRTGSFLSRIEAGAKNMAM